MADRHQQKPYPLRMPEDLRTALQEASAKGGRSLHAEIVRRLEDSFFHDLPAIEELDSIGVPEILERQRITIEKHAAEMQFVNAYLSSKLMKLELERRQDDGQDSAEALLRQIERTRRHDARTLELHAIRLTQRLDDLAAGKASPDILDEPGVIRKQLDSIRYVLENSRHEVALLDGRAVFENSEEYDLRIKRSVGRHAG